MFYFISDPDYKLKSAAQTPATMHSSRSNEHNSCHEGMVGRSIDDRKYLVSI